ncbi:hypothetical protein N7450_009960 [Penicillium hetheringtonii]|uniref:Uncharacterized protein n=1 Tax=Penicillium hetheringtonii TaxID=911720 RepID=A0AAD6GPA2_9EURO|nr:hypothetical protein N7450_009960 [Penicillium hetheringtonii]
MLTPFVSQLPPNMINPSPPGSDVGVKESSSDPMVPPRKPNLNGKDPGDSASLLKLASLPPPVVPLGNEEDRPTTPAPCAPTNEDGVHSVPLITAIDHLKEVINLKEIPPPTSPHYSSVSGGLCLEPPQRQKDVAMLLKDAVSELTVAVRREKEKLEGVDAVSPKGERHRRDKIPWDNGGGESQNLLEQKPEQVNSYTKRRDRRENQAKGRKDHASKGRHMHMFMSSK